MCVCVQHQLRLQGQSRPWWLLFVGLLQLPNLSLVSTFQALGETTWQFLQVQNVKLLHQLNSKIVDQCHESHDFFQAAENRVFLLVEATVCCYYTIEVKQEFRCLMCRTYSFGQLFPLPEHSNANMLCSGYCRIIMCIHSHFPSLSTTPNSLPG